MSAGPMEGCSVDDEDDGDGSSVTWHRLLLGGRTSSFFDTPEPAEEESAPESLLSDATETAGEEEEDVVNAVLRNEGSTNYDSGNFSFSESSKGKSAASPGSQDLAHERYVQLNTELYQTRTELLTYKYKWNEIRNEVELEWTKKYRRLEDEKGVLQQEVERLEELLRVSESRVPAGGSSLDILKLQSELDQTKVQLECKDRANVVLKEKIAEQYCDRENLSLEVRKLGKVLLEIKNELSSVRSSEQWFRDELHTCQNVNAKLRESNLQLENRISIERANHDRLKLELQQVIRNAEEVERRAIKEKEDLLEKLRSIEASNKLENVSDFVLQETLQKLQESSEKIKFLSESNKSYQQQAERLECNIGLLKSNLSNQEALIQSCKNKENETISRIATLEAENATLKAAREHARQENTQLHLDIARQNFTNRDLDVSIGHLRAQLQVLSINFENTRQALAVKEFALEKLDQDNRELREQNDQLERCREDLQRRLSMSESLAKDQYEKLLDNFRTIQSKNLDLELKLGQCTEYNEKFRKSEQVVRQLKKDIEELQERLQRDSIKMSSSESSNCASISRSSSTDNSDEASADVKNSKTCQKHGKGLPDDDTKQLKILLKVIESEHRQKLKRYELNNRTLLKKVKEHERARLNAEQQVESLEKDVCRIGSMECELAGMREKTMLLEADLDSAVEERDALKSEKLRLIMALQNSCLVHADEDIWTAFQRIFADLRDKQHVHKENQRFKELLQISEKKIQQLEDELKQSLSSSEEKSTVIENLKLEGEIQRVESDEIRSELTIKNLQLEDSQRILTELSSERNSLQDSIGSRQQEELKLRDQIDSLQKKLQVCVVQLETAYARLQLYEESERILEESRHRFFNDLQVLRDEILAEKLEKQALQDAVTELKAELVRMVECNLKSDHIATSDDQSDNSVDVSSVPSLVDSGSDSSAPKFNEDSLRALVSECSRRSSARPLQECVASLRAEMHQLNSVVRQNGNQRYHHVVSLMEELQDATNGTYNSR